MRANVPLYTLKSPRDLDDALRLLADRQDNWTPFAGGTDLMVLFEAGHLKRKNFLNLWGIPELSEISIHENEVILGSLVTYAQIRKNMILQKEFPNLCRAAGETGALSIQNRGTLGGNIANASPAADTPPTLLTYDAEVELRSKAGARWVPYASFHTGYKKTLLQENELISRIRLPRKFAAWVHYYRKVGTRRAQAITKVGFSSALSLNQGLIQEIRIGLASVAPVPLRCLKTEAFLRGQKLNPSLIHQARHALAGEIQPIDDIRSTLEYRRQVASNLLEDFLTRESEQSGQN